MVYTFDIEHFQLKFHNNNKNLAFREKTEFSFLPDVIKIYEPFETTFCTYFLNEIGQVVSFHRIDTNLNEQELLEFYENYDNGDENKTHEKVVKDISLVFGAKLEPDTVSILSVDIFKTEKIKWDHCRIKNDNLQYFIECQFIFQLTKSFDKNIKHFLKEFNTYYRSKIINNLLPSILSVNEPNQFLINDDEQKEYLKYYSVWELQKIINHSKEKFEVSMTNLNHIYQRQTNHQLFFLNFILLSLATLSLIGILPNLKKSFPESINEVLATKIILIISFLFILIIFHSPIKSMFLKIFYFGKNRYTRHKMKKSKI